MPDEHFLDALCTALREVGRWPRFHVTTLAVALRTHESVARELLCGWERAGFVVRHDREGKNWSWNK
jgi:hypothetical protein